MKAEDIYTRLRKEIDERMPVGMPASPDGSDISLLKKLFTEKEAQIAIYLSALPESLNRIHKRIRKHGFPYSIGEVEVILETMMGKGLIQGGSLFPKPKHYSLSQFAIGIYEFQVDRQDKEFAHHARNYMNKSFISEFYKRDRPGQMRTIPVEESLNMGPAVSTYDDIRVLAETVPEPIAIMNCVCKQSRDLEKEPCKLSERRDTCFVFDNFAQHILDNNVPSARAITRDEFISTIGELEKNGYVLQPQNTKIPKFLCACCGCCCNVLLGYKMLPRPADYFQSNFRAETISDNCTACEACVSRCQMDAITMQEGVAVIDENRCIGCGNCVTICSQGAIKMKAREHHHVPARNHDSLYQTIMMKKLGTLGSMKLIGKMITGMKV